jgi:hypothetical protein
LERGARLKRAFFIFVLEMFRPGVTVSAPFWSEGIIMFRFRLGLARILVCFGHLFFFVSATSFLQA